MRIIASSVHHYTFFLLLFYDSVAVAEECLVVALLICLLVFVAVSVGTTNKNRQYIDIDNLLSFNSSSFMEIRVVFSLFIFTPRGMKI